MTHLQRESTPETETSELDVSFPGGWRAASVTMDASPIWLVLFEGAGKAPARRFARADIDKGIMVDPLQFELSPPDKAKLFEQLRSRARSRRIRQLQELEERARK